MVTSLVTGLLVIFTSICCGQENVKSQTIDDVLKENAKMKEDNARMQVEIAELFRRVDVNAKLGFEVADLSRRIDANTKRVEDASAYSKHCAYLGGPWTTPNSTITYDASWGGGTGKFYTSSGLFQVADRGYFMLTLSASMELPHEGDVALISLFKNGVEIWETKWDSDSNEGAGASVDQGAKTVILYMSNGDIVQWKTYPWFQGQVRYATFCV